MLRRTPLYDEEARLGARFTEFAGWELALSYSGIIKEHMAVRSSVGLFDVSHLGKVRVRGGGALRLLQRLATIDMEKIAVGKGAYTVFCNEFGGILDDDILYRAAEEEFMVVTNASRREVIYSWLVEHASPDVEVADLTEEYGLLALQGPGAPGILRETLGDDPNAYKRYTVRTVSLEGNKLTVSRSGYTGEEGFEIIAAPDAARAAWRRIIEAGATPAGIGARDTLRLEMGYPLYGRELREKTTPIEAGLAWLVNFDKGDFVGRDALVRQKERGPVNRLIGFTVDSGIARGGERVCEVGGERIGIVISGGYSPVRKQGIGLAYVRSEFAEEGLKIRLEARRKELTGHLTKPPFVKKQGQA